MSIGVYSSCKYVGTRSVSRRTHQIEESCYIASYDFHLWKGEIKVRSEAISATVGLEHVVSLCSVHLLASKASHLLACVLHTALAIKLQPLYCIIISKYKSSIRSPEIKSYLFSTSSEYSIRVLDLPPSSFQHNVATVSQP